MFLKKQKKIHFATRLQTFESLEPSRRQLKGKKKVFKLWDVSGGRMAAFPIRLNGLAGLIFQAGELSEATAP